jgi:hypothetical protein
LRIVFLKRLCQGFSIRNFGLELLYSLILLLLITNLSRHNLDFCSYHRIGIFQRAILKRQRPHLLTQLLYLVQITRPQRALIPPPCLHCVVLKIPTFISHVMQLLSILHLLQQPLFHPLRGLHTVEQDLM